ncbi:MAG: virulence factor SrfB [Prevotella sp.]|nr:virulence factor SrfB [Prevotella sp.]
MIANSGLHFQTTEIEFNPEEQLPLPDGRTMLRYTFIEKVDFLNNMRVSVDVCARRGDSFVPIDYLRKNDLLEQQANGTVALDAVGVPMMKKDVVLSMVESYETGAPELIPISSLQWRLKRRLPDGRRETVMALDQLLGKWLPMPMYELEVTGQCMSYPHGWCRVKIDPIGQPQKNGKQRYRLTWAFDTQLAKDMVEGEVKPGFFAGSGEQKEYMLSNRVDNLFGGFLNIPDGQNDDAIAGYIVSLLGINLEEENEDEPKYKFLCYYVYLINFLRLWWDKDDPQAWAAPKVTLYNKKDRQIPVDMSVDIGNSRTCAVLFEDGDFTKAKILRLRDMTEPWRVYRNAFDMRVVFRRADFGNDMNLDKTLFQWPSLLRVGEEARHLIYRSQHGDDNNDSNDNKNNNVSEKTTNYSSPKRYLWDSKPFKDRWEFMVVEGDSTNQTLDKDKGIFIKGLTDYFDDDGTYLPDGKQIDIFNLPETDNSCHYSRQSLMTFVFIEMLQQALCYINSSEFRGKHLQIDCRRYLRNIIVTCPTAMPMKEQLALRRAAKAAADLIHQFTPAQPEMTITPDPALLKPTDDPELMEKRGWLYDEAFASQLVYLNAELHERYGGRVDQFFSLKGHKRKEMEEMGFEGNQLTVGTVDIGAGTTDVMVVSYGQKGQGRLTPVPLYYDSFYTAGDDIIHNVILNIFLEGPYDDNPMMGSVRSALTARIMRMTPDELRQIPRIADTPIYQARVADIEHAFSEEAALDQRRHLIFELMNHFFASDSNNQDGKDRQCRLDFCTQVTHPMAQFFLELLNQQRPARLYNFDDIFSDGRPAQFLLDHFRYHFGFGFEELQWRYDPEQVGFQVSHTMMPLMRALSVVMYAHHCDVLVLSGRPTSLIPLTELFVKYLPLSPHRLVLLNKYRVGRWFPLATEEGYFQEGQKAVVAVGAEVGRLASTTGFKGLVLDFSTIAKTMKSTACYMGPFDDQLSQVRKPFLTPETSSATLKGISVFPYYIGCKQFDAPQYEARPIYAIYNHSRKPQLNIMLQRNYYEDREELTLDEVTDMDGDNVSLKDVELRMQTIAQDGRYWLDRGDFVLTVEEKKS